MNKLQFYKNIRAMNLVIIFFQAKLIEDSNIFNLLNKRIIVTMTHLHLIR